MSIENFSDLFISRLAGVYPLDEAKAITDLVFTTVLKCDRLQLSVRKKDSLPGDDESMLEQLLERLIQGEPVQYVLGETFFYGCRIMVNPSVLIPRPETEFLTDMVVKENRKDGMKVLDICTGSGCIAIALQKNLLNARVTGLDISEHALQTAMQNAVENNSPVEFLQFDVLNKSQDLPFETFDIIISNPPYVTPGEKPAMHKNVREFEPHLALFVADSDPLIFYKAIGEIAQKRLADGGKIYLEINDAYSNKLSIYFKNLGYDQVNIRADQYGRQRFLIIS